jgi:hypothetical protein
MSRTETRNLQNSTIADLTLLTEDLPAGYILTMNMDGDYGERTITQMVIDDDAKTVRFS